MQQKEFPPPKLIETPANLRTLVEELTVFKHIAVDTESNSLHAYRERLCLIQFSTPQGDYLVDTLAVNDLSPLMPLFANPFIEKIFHAVEYDLICLKRDSGISIENIFDTMQAARILGCKQVGLDSILEQKLGVQLEKKFQKADWGKRPLSFEMLNYARLDTHYLLALRDCLKTDLLVEGRWELAQEEFSRLAHGNEEEKAEIPAWQRVKGTQKLDNRQLTVLKELCTWREKQARHMDRPPFKVIDDKRLVAITQGLPVSRDDLTALGLTKHQIRIFGNEILRSVSHGMQTTLVNRLTPRRPNHAYMERMNSLSDWRKLTGRKIGVESDIILPKSWMHTIAERNPKNLDDLAKLMPQAPWRLNQFGAGILNAISLKHMKHEPSSKKYEKTKREQ
jgi:ribonuclease D